MKFRKRTIVTFLITLMILGFAQDQVSFATGSYNIISVDHTPKPLQRNENITITIDFSDTINVTYVKLFICQLEPEFLCEDAPIFMEEQETYSYEGVFLIIYDEGTSVGYHIQIVYSNGSYVVIPDISNFLSATNIVEPESGNYYFDAGTVEEQTERTSSLNVLYFTSAIAVISIVIRRKKDK